MEKLQVELFLSRSNGDKKTLGIMMIGEYTFETNDAELWK